MMTAFLSLSTVTPGCAGSAPANRTRVRTATMRRMAEFLSCSLVPDAHHRRRAVDERAGQVAGGDVDPAAVYHRPAVDHAGRFYLRVFAQVEFPLRRHAVIERESVNHSLEIDDVNRVPRDGRRSEKGRLG